VRGTKALRQHLQPTRIALMLFWVTMQLRESLLRADPIANNLLAASSSSAASSRRRLLVRS
jgi:hypothetical protein